MNRLVIIIPLFFITMCGEAPVTPPAGALEVDDRLMLKIMDYANGVRPLNKEMTDPNDAIMEVGEAWGTAITRLRRKASRIIESTLGSTIAREIIKDREGNYSPSIVQATALKTAILFIMAHNPIHGDLEPLKGEYDDIMAKIKSGRIIMTGHRSADDSKGIMRGVQEGTLLWEDTEIGEYFQDVFPIEMKGSYTGSGYELLYLYMYGFVDGLGDDGKMELSYWVKGKSSTKLVDKTLIDETVINFDYQYLGLDDLYVRFSHRDLRLADFRRIGAGINPVGEAFIGGAIIYEIELWGSDIKPTVSQAKPVELERGTLWQ